MDKPISVGDLVVIVKPTPCCGDDRSIGVMFRVGGFENAESGCRICHKMRRSLSAQVGDTWALVDLYRIKRIPPLSELEGEKREEKLLEPV